MTTQQFLKKLLGLSYTFAVLLIIPLLAYYTARIVGLTGKNSSLVYAAYGLMSILIGHYGAKDYLARGAILGGSLCVFIAFTSILTNTIFFTTLGLVSLFFGYYTEDDFLSVCMTLLGATCLLIVLSPLVGGGLALSFESVVGLLSLLGALGVLTVTCYNESELIS